MDAVRFVLPNGLHASIIELENNPMAQVLVARWFADLGIHTISIKMFLVLAIWIRDEAIYFVYNELSANGRLATSEVVQKALVSGQWNMLENAYLIIYDETVYWAHSSFDIFKQAIRRKMEPNVFALVNP